MARPIPYSRQRIGPEDVEAVAKVLERDLITQGPEVAALEEDLAGACGAAFAVCFNSGTSALWAAVHALEIEPGSEGIVPAITFAATATALVANGVRPVIVDVDEKTGNIDPQAFEASLTEATAVVMVVHYAGLPAPIEAIAEVARSRGIKVIEDAAHALGAHYGGTRVGACAHSDAAVFSFHPVKAITTGEGGALLTNDAEVAERARRFRHHGIQPLDDVEPWLYDVRTLGLNGRITDFQCALGRSQLRKLESFILERNDVARFYDSRLAGIEGISPAARAPEGSRHAYHLYPAKVERSEARGALFRHLLECGIRPQVHYIPLHYHTLFKAHSAPPRGALPAAEAFYEREISLPVYPGMSEEERTAVVSAVEEFFERRRA